jgi:hypothetical protein
MNHVIHAPAEIEHNSTSSLLMHSAQDSFVIQSIKAHDRSSLKGGSIYGSFNSNYPIETKVAAVGVGTSIVYED